jgi:hypothetical protein
LRKEANISTCRETIVAWTKEMAAIQEAGTTCTRHESKAISRPPEHTFSLLMASTEHLRLMSLFDHVYCSSSHCDPLYI